jgi:hypothetical protein
MTALKLTLSRTLPAVALAALVFASPIAAQSGPHEHGGDQPTPRTPGGMMGMMGRGGMMGMMEMMGMADHLEGRIAFLRAELKITDDQTPQWNAFAGALRANAGRMMEMRKAMMQGEMMQGGIMGQGDASVNAPDRLNRMERMMTAMLEAVKATKSALAPLYAVLTDEQKKVADQLIHAPMGMGRM